MSLFSALTLAPRDPILGLTEAFNADPRPSKVNLGVGVYTDDKGRLPLLSAVRAAEQRLFEAAAPHDYQPIDGNAAYNAAVRRGFSADRARPDRDGAGARRHRRAENRRGLSEVFESKCKSRHQRSQLGKPPRAV